MSTLKLFKETALPAVLQANSIYLVAPAAHPTLVELYVTNAAGDAYRHVIGRTEIQAMIDASVAAANELTIVADVTARNALSPSRALYVYVVDATGDATVASGGATYLYNPTSTSWIKTSESEAMDVALTWASLSGKPSATPAQIDAAVAASHQHANLTQLNQIGQNAAGELTYGGAQVKTEWSSTSW